MAKKLHINTDTNVDNEVACPVCGTMLHINSLTTPVRVSWARCTGCKKPIEIFVGFDVGIGVLELDEEDIL